MTPQERTARLWAMLASPEQRLLSPPEPRRPHKEPTNRPAIYNRQDDPYGAILKHLQEAPGATVSDMAKALHAPNRTLQDRLKRLLGEGCVRFNRAYENGAGHWYITAAGRERLAEIEREEVA